jgi:hypothetical protein
MAITLPLPTDMERSIYVAMWKFLCQVFLQWRDDHSAVCHAGLLLVSLCRFAQHQTVITSVVALQYTFHSHLCM